MRSILHAINPSFYLLIVNFKIIARFLPELKAFYHMPEPKNLFIVFFDVLIVVGVTMSHAGFGLGITRLLS
jgi:aspartyl/asparaginyl-tRNA synthetase